ncbi:MAG: hypothetical protein J5I98_34710 [Phaeodactylibacter sp.]|nr:hypothetical protein [Phaeodactylibacter sp.]
MVSLFYGFTVGSSLPACPWNHEAMSHEKESHRGLIINGKHLVKLMGGRISVHSELGAGSEFTVALPVTRQKPVKPTAPEILIPAVDPALAKPILPRVEKKRASP